MKNLAKIKSYFGLARRNRSALLGVSQITECAAKVIIFSSELSLASKEKLRSSAKTKNTFQFEISSEEMLEITQNPKILAFGIADSSLASAIKNNIQTLEE